MTDTNSKSNCTALDTNVIWNLIKDPNFADMLVMRGHLQGGAVVHICGAVEHELAKYGFDAADPLLEARGATVVYGHITAEMRAGARAMEDRYKDLHYPDSLILAYAKAQGIGLMTRDKKLAAAAEFEGVRVVNPDQVCCSGGRFRGRYDSSGRFRGRYDSSGRAHPRPRRPGPGSAPAAAPKRRRRNLRRRAYPHPRNP